TKRFAPSPAVAAWTVQRIAAPSIPRKTASRSRIGTSRFSGSIGTAASGGLEDRDDGERQKELGEDEERPPLTYVIEQDRRDPRQERERVDREDRQAARHPEAG